MSKRIALCALILAGATPLAAQEPDYEARAADLKSLSRAFGELHAIRRLCDPDREAEAWRDRMRKLIDLETPAPSLRDEMIGEFNDGFRSAQARFPYCDRDARDHAALVATDADKAATRLVEPIYEALARPAIDPYAPPAPPASNDDDDNNDSPY